MAKRIPTMAGDLRLALDCDAFATAAGLEGEGLDGWQRQVLEAEQDKILLNCSRQSGKSTIAALLACRTAVFEPNALVLCVSPSQRQSGELFRRVLGFYHALPVKPQVKSESALRIELMNGARVLSLPGSERTTRGYARARLIILDEASRIEDQLISSLRPMLATSRGGRFISMSTPYGRRGWFHDAWHADDPGWLKLSVTAEQCPRIPPEFLAEQERELGPLLYRQEYACEFVDDAETLFSSEIVEAAFDPRVRPLFPVAA
jgi:Terminase large subunit, T4likevirus-type, N-terminal